MTREEAIVDIRENIKPVVGGKSLDMAIKALAQEPCGDAISRAEAINAISHAEVNFTVTSKIDFADYKCEIQEIVDHIVEAQVKALNDLPPVSPQPRTGRWIDAEVLDKIRAEIDEQYDRVHPYDISCAEGLEMALGIIDKYKAESEDKK